MGKRESSWLLLLAGLALLIFLYLGGYLRPAEGKGELGIALTIYYEDGTSKVVDPFKSSVLPLAVVDQSGTPINRVEYAVKTRVTWSGQKTSHSVGGSVWLEVNGVRKTTLSIINPPTLDNGIITTLWQGTVKNTDLESWGTSGATNTLTINAQVTVTLSFSNGSSDMKTGTGKADFQYKIQQSSIVGLEVIVNANAYAEGM
jgi:hypothetical protein